MQNSSYNHFILICKTGHLEARALGQKIAHWLEQKGYTTQVCNRDEVEEVDFNRPQSLAIVLGGDGTVLSVGRRLVGLNIPILGLNFGKVGFLTTAQPKQWKECLEACLKGQISRQDRLALKWQHFRGQDLLAQGYAINDVVISHGTLARLVHVDIAINQENLGLLRCDGIILATPIGSSGYTASAGGPIIFTQTEAFVFTPICPFMRSLSPMIFPPNVVFDIYLAKGSTDCGLTIDGQEGYPLNCEDLIKISAAPKSVHFLGHEEIFLERIRSRSIT
ncbi:MAG: NAD(+)/NADH kinase, partial [Desulfovibrionaceae bacterium]|nr:NAD(+)/NADH kinase [Desulfovibrionaceae bacterium]